MKKWYQDWKSWITIVFLLFIPTFIIGVILMWAIAPWSKKSKWWITGIGIGVPVVGILASLLLFFVSPKNKLIGASDVAKRAAVQEISSQATRFCLEVGRCPDHINEIRERGYLKNIPVDPDTKTYYFYEISADGKDCIVKTTLGTKEEFIRSCTSSYTP